MAEDQPGPLHPHAAGPARPADRRRQVLSELAPLVSAQHGVFYIPDAHDGRGDAEALRQLRLQRAQDSRTRSAGRGPGRAVALEKQRILLTDVPTDYIQISSGLGEAAPLNIVVLPVLFEGDVKAVIELASFHRFTAIHLAFLDQLTESIGIVLTRSRPTCAPRSCCAVPVADPRSCRRSRKSCSRPTRSWRRRPRCSPSRRREVEQQEPRGRGRQQELEEKAEQLALTSKYKSEFLANMSHELRTPLNSLLILSELLADNADGNLTPKQVEFAETIHSSGADLLAADQRDPRPRQDRVGHDGRRRRRRSRSPTCRSTSSGPSARWRRRRGSTSTIELDAGLPAAIDTDAQAAPAGAAEPALQRLQVHRERQGRRCGSSRATGWSSTTTRSTAPSRDRLLGHRHRHRHPGRQAADHLRGVPAGRRHHQPQVRRHRPRPVDQPRDRRACSAARSASTARRAGAAPSRSTCPQAYVRRRPRRPTRRAADRPPRRRRSSAAARTARDAARRVADDRPSPSATLGARRRPRRDPARRPRPPDRRGRRQLRARSCSTLARETGFKGLVAPRGDAGLALAREFKPDAITLDIRLPDMDGWTVLDRLKHDPTTRHIPVHIISGRRGAPARPEAGRLRLPAEARDRRGARRGLRQHPALRRAARSKSLLVVEDDEIQRNSIVELIGNGDVDHDRRRTAARRRWTRSRPSASTAWCSTSACPT